MRVLHIFSELKYSGAEIMYTDAAQLFQKQNIEMLALSTGEQIGEFLPRFEAENIEVLHKPLKFGEINPIILCRYFYGIYKLIKQQNIKKVHIHRAGHFLFFSMAAYFAGVKAIRTVHNVFKHRKITWVKGYLDRFLARKLFKVTFQTIGTSVYENELNYYKNDSKVVNNWYDEKNFFPPISEEEQQTVRKKLGISATATVIISTGGCSHIKNHHDIIKALKIVNEKIECIYLHLGQGKTENEEQKLAQSLGVYDKIHFLGNHDNVRDYLIASDIYIMPSRFEGLGNAALEAMACGLPSILYNVPGLKDLIKNDDNGFLIDQSHKVIAEKVLTLVEDPLLRKSKGIKAHQFVKENFSVANGVKGIMQLYID